MGNVVKGTEIATIDCALVSVQGYGIDDDEIILDTANKIEVTIQTETVEKIALIVKGRLISQKPQQTTVTGNSIVLTDNVFNDKIVLMIQGGTVKYDEDGTTFKGYTPPVVGSNDKGKIFKLKAYSAIYSAAGVLLGYECIIYPNCQGVPISLNSEDGVFRVNEYTINSAPAQGEAPWDMEIIAPEDLPKVTVVTEP